MIILRTIRRRMAQCRLARIVEANKNPEYAKRRAAGKLGWQRRSEHHAVKGEV